jgi:hypothetical protein
MDETDFSVDRWISPSGKRKPEGANIGVSSGVIWGM